MSKVAIVYWSGTGNTEAIAKAIAKGALANGSEANVFTAQEFDANKLDLFDSFALGCPAMGAEELEDSEFLPMYESIKSGLASKKVAIFGSYGWGGGEYMNAWESDLNSLGVNLVTKPLAIEGFPDEQGINLAEALGKLL